MQFRDYIKEKTSKTTETDSRTRVYLSPVKICYETPDLVTGCECLLDKKPAQITLEPKSACTIKKNGSIVLDFGTEIFGGIQISVFHGSGDSGVASVRLRFGESLSEVFSELGGRQNATNDHAVRDSVVCLGSLASTSEFGNTGFRFARIDLLEEEFIVIKFIRAVMLIRDIEYKGSFECSDERLNRIWNTAAYTAHLNMQEYLLDGIKRDQLVWIGDMGPETATIQSVFGYNEVVPKSLNFVRDETPLPGWMNGIASYSMWWILILYGWHMQNGDMIFLKENHKYLSELCRLFGDYVNNDGSERTDGMRFLDWPTRENSMGTDAGVHALLTYAMDRAGRLFGFLDDAPMQEFCAELCSKLRRWIPDANGSKQAEAFQVLAGIKKLPSDGGKPENLKNLLSENMEGISTFLGYYILEAKARNKQMDQCLDIIRTYWGKMIDLGATTFWEDFDLSWADNANHIDELPLGEQDDIHGDKGAHCYQGFRHSLCHGWASGPAPFLSENVLGIKILKPGCKSISINPDLGDLKWAHGTYPTPYGLITVSHRRLDDDTIQSECNVPDGIVVRDAQIIKMFMNSKQQKN